jgi:hypothetical protein
MLQKSHIKTQGSGTEVSERRRSDHTRIYMPEKLIRLINKKLIKYRLKERYTETV